MYLYYWVGDSVVLYIKLLKFFNGRKYGKLEGKRKIGGERVKFFI